MNCSWLMAQDSCCMARGRGTLARPTNDSNNGQERIEPNLLGHGCRATKLIIRLIDFIILMVARKRCVFCCALLQVAFLCYDFGVCF